MLKLNLGCGTNRIAGWENHDAEVDLNKPLPWGNESAQFILIEHVLEHFNSCRGYQILEECARVLAPGGIVRICVPDVARIEHAANPGYAEFVRRGGWGNSPIKAIATCHGHEMLWHYDTISAVLRNIGLKPERCRPHQSRHAELRNVDGHHRVIGEEFNDLESLVVEATKPPRPALAINAAAPLAFSAPPQGKRRLVFGTLYLRNAEQTALAHMWIQLARHHHRCDWLLIDSESPAALASQLGAPRRHIREGIQPNTIVNLGDNIGHLGATGRDGWGRAFVTGLQYAIDAGYDQVVHMEGDLLSKVAFDDVFALMAATGRRAACPFCPYVRAAETGMMYFDVPFLKQNDFIRRYDWPNSPPLPGPQPERRIMELLAPDLLWLPWETKGCRNDHVWIEAQADIADMELSDFVRTLYYLTHAKPAYFQAYLEDVKNGLIRLDLEEQRRLATSRRLRPL